MLKKIILCTAFLSQVTLPITNEQLEKFSQHIHEECEHMPWWLSLLVGGKQECKKYVQEQVNLLKSFIKKLDKESDNKSEEILKKWEIGVTSPLDCITKSEILELAEEHPILKRNLVSDGELQGLHSTDRKEKRWKNTKKELHVLYAQAYLAQRVDDFLIEINKLNNK